MTNIHDMVNQIQKAVREMEDSGFLDQLADGARETKKPQLKETEIKKDDKDQKLDDN